MSNGIRVDVPAANGNRLAGTIPPFDREFYDRVPKDTPEATLWGLNVKLNWRGGYGKVVSILVESADLEKLTSIGFKPT